MSRSPSMLGSGTIRASRRTQPGVNWDWNCSEGTERPVLEPADKQFAASWVAGIAGDEAA